MLVGFRLPAACFLPLLPFSSDRRGGMWRLPRRVSSSELCLRWHGNICIFPRAHTYTGHTLHTHTHAHLLLGSGASASVSSDRSPLPSLASGLSAVRCDDVWWMSKNLGGKALQRVRQDREWRGEWRNGSFCSVQRVDKDTTADLIGRVIRLSR